MHEIVNLLEWQKCGVLFVKSVYSMFDKSKDINQIVENFNFLIRNGNKSSISTRAILMLFSTPINVLIILKDCFIWFSSLGYTAALHSIVLGYVFSYLHS